MDMATVVYYSSTTRKKGHAFEDIIVVQRKRLKA